MMEDREFYGTGVGASYWLLLVPLDSYCGLYGTGCPGGFHVSETPHCGHCILDWLFGHYIGADKSWVSVQSHLKVLAHHYGRDKG